MTMRFACLLAMMLTMLALAACAPPAVGPAALHNGRAAYNTVINETEDQQILSMIVRRRYDDTFGMLAVSSVTASLRVGASAGANVGIGPSSGYEGNLIPLSAGAMYEENPTISYVPLRGEQFMQRMLAPISAEQAVLLSRMSTDEAEVLQLLVRRVNGVTNPLYWSPPDPAGGEQDRFARFLNLYTDLRDRGRLDIIQTEDDRYQLLLHDYAGGDEEAARALLDVLEIDRRGAEGGGALDDGAPLALPLRFAVGSAGTGGVDMETPSALEAIEAAAEAVEAPADHIAAGLARPPKPTAGRPFLAIHATRIRPAEASVAVMHRGWWFYIDGRDTRSKQAFMILRTLIGLRLDEAATGQSAPVLTVPVAR